MITKTMSEMLNLDGSVAQDDIFIYLLALYIENCQDVWLSYTILKFC